MTTKTKQAATVAVAAAIGRVAVRALAVVSSRQSPPEHEEARRERAERLAELARESERTRKIAQDRYADLWERDDRSRSVGQSRAIQEHGMLQWVYDLSPEFLRAESFGEALHVTISAEFNRGWLIESCDGQRAFVSNLFAEWKGR